jgi:FtsP/CotA-like multicopper oxidase with cupredoxin domain
MTLQMTRRQWLAGATALVSAATIRSPLQAAQSAVRRLAIGSATLDVDGRAAKVFRLVDAAGKPGLTLDPGEPFQVALENGLSVPSLVHWHGQTPPWTQDGFPWPQTPPLAPGATAAYDFTPLPGTYWMHSHAGLQEQRLLAAPLIVRDEETRREDRQEVVLMLHDFSFREPYELLASLTGGSTAKADAMADQSENAPAPKGSMPGMAMDHAMGGMDMKGASMGGAAPMKPMAGMGKTMAMDLNDIAYDAFLVNDRTLRDPDVVRVAPKARLRLRIINGAASSQFWIDLGALEGRVVAVDGHAVKPVAGRLFPMAIAQRLDILIDLPGAGAFPLLAQLEGSRRRTGLVLATEGAAVPRVAEALKDAPPVDNSLEARLIATDPLKARPAGLSAKIVLSGGMSPYRWALNGEYWPAITPVMLKQGERVEIDLENPSMMAHPMHLHGHTFQVIALNGRPIEGARRDTVLVPPMGSVRIAFDADNPGRWVFHCHNLYHMATGMMTEFRYEGIAI